MEKLKVFISSKMAEMRDVREFVAKALDNRGIEAWVYEAHAGARPEDVIETSLSEVEAADIYVGLFWEKYGQVTVQEYRHARALDKPCFVYIRYKDIQREKALEDFLEDEVYDLQKGVTYDYFDSAVELGQQVADNIMAWLVRRHREMTAEIQEAGVSQDEIARLQAGVDRLQAASREPLPQGTPADYLAQQMRAWFETLGYRFESHDVRAEGYFEWIINIPARRGYDRILVCGIEGEAELSDVAALRQAVDKQKTDEGWLVAARRKSQAACEEVEKKENRDLFCYTFDELLDEHADFSGYLDWLEVEVKRQGIDRMYIPLACIKDEFDPATKREIGESRYDERNGWIDGYVDRWLDDPAKEHISILGEFGTGKTWFALHYAWTALENYRKAKERGVERPRLPLVIPLRDYAKAVSVESLFSEFFFRKHEIPLPGYSAFEQLNRMGKLLLIFDGFDEMAAKVDRQKMINNFWELARVVVPGAKAILTCRTEHFPEAREGRALLSAELQASTAKLTGEPPQFEMLELEKFDDAQIRKVLSLRAEPAIVEQVMGSPELLDLARRPVMTEFILEALPDIEAGKPVDLSRIYLYAVRRKMERDIKAERTFTSLADKLYFLCELSWEMLSTDQMSFNYRLFPDRLRRLFGYAVQEQKDLDHWHYDMMGQTMLIRNADGDYTPAHRSLLEFFVAYKFAAELGVLPPDFTELARAQSHLDAGVPPQDYTWSAYFQREMDERDEIIPIPPLNAFCRESLVHLRATTGHTPLTKAILDLLVPMLDIAEAAARWPLLDIIEETRDKTEADVGYTGGNATTLLVRVDHAGLKGRDLTRTVIMGANLVNASLYNSVLYEANLRETNFQNTDLTGCNLQRANLQHAQFRGTTLANADLRDADLTDAQFSEMGGVCSVAFSPDGTLLAGGGYDANVYLWNVVDCAERPVCRGHEGTITALTWHPEEQVLASCGYDGTVKTWDVHGGSLLSTLDIRGQVRERYGTFNIRYASSSTLYALTMEKVVRIKNFKIDKIFVYGYRLLLAFGLAVSSDRIALCDPHGSVAILHPDELEVIDHFALELAPPHQVRHLAVQTCFLDKSTLAVGCSDSHSKGTIVWDLVSKKAHRLVSRDESPARALAYNPAYTELAVGSFSGYVSIWDKSSWKKIAEWKAHEDEINSLSFARSGDILVSGSADATIRFWDTRSFVTRSGEPHINVIEYTPPDLSAMTDDPATWPQWWQECKIDVPEGMVPNPDFGKCLRIIEQKLNCQGLQLARAKGLDAVAGTKEVFNEKTQESEDKNVTLGEWLEARGAVLKHGFLGLGIGRGQS